MNLNDKSGISWTRENTMQELTKEEKYSKVIDICLKDVHKVCFLLTKDNEKASVLMEKVLVDFYDIFEVMIDFDSTDIEKELESKRILSYLTKMAIKQFKKES